MPKKERPPRVQNPILRRLAQDSKQSPAYHASAGLERKLAGRVNGRRTSGSGNQWQKGDVVKKGVARFEHKATSKQSFRVTTDMLEKLELAARGSDEIPILVVDFLDSRGKTHQREIAVLPLKDLLDLIDDG